MTLPKITTITTRTQIIIPIKEKKENQRNNEDLNISSNPNIIQVSLVVIIVFLIIHSLTHSFVCLFIYLLFIDS